jgi:hypothetical protein
VKKIKSPAKGLLHEVGKYIGIFVE